MIVTLGYLVAHIMVFIVANVMLYIGVKYDIEFFILYAALLYTILLFKISMDIGLIDALMNIFNAPIWNYRIW